MSSSSNTMRNVAVFNDAAAVTGAWVRLPTKTGLEANPRSIQMSITTGDTIVIEVTNDIDNLAGTPETTASPAYDSTDTGDTLHGPWGAIRVVKTGANGPCVVSIQA